MFLFSNQLDNSTNLALHDLNVSLENRLLEKSSFRNTLIVKQNDLNQQFNTNTLNYNKKKETLKRQNISTSNNTQPQYAEIYSPSHYASTGLFVDNINLNSATTTSSSNNLDHSNTNTNSTFILNNNDKKFKTILNQNGKVVIKVRFPP